MWSLVCVRGNDVELKKEKEIQVANYSISTWKMKGKRDFYNFFPSYFL